MLRTELITVDPEIMGGTPTFTNTRVAVQTLFDYLAAGASLADFLEGHPGVGRAQAEGVLQLAASMLVPDYLHVEPAQVDFSFADNFDHETAT